MQAPLKPEAPLLLEIFHGIFQSVDVRELLSGSVPPGTSGGAGSHG